MGRFVVVNTIGLGILLATWLSGGADLILTADRVYAGPIVAVLTVFGLVMAAMRRWEDARWIADKLPIVGLIGTVLGVLLAIKGIDGVDIDSARVQIFTEVGQALVANMLGMLGYAWLALVVRLCRE